MYIHTNTHMCIYIYIYIHTHKCACKYTHTLSDMPYATCHTTRVMCHARLHAHTHTHHDACMLHTS